jgi:hypothetical protein
MAISLAWSANQKAGAQVAAITIGQTDIEDDAVESRIGGGQSCFRLGEIGGLNDRKLSVDRQLLRQRRP